MTITEAITIGNLTKKEIAKAFHVEVAEILEIRQKMMDMLMDDGVTDEQYQEWCNKIDELYNTI